MTDFSVSISYLSPSPSICPDRIPAGSCPGAPPVFRSIEEERCTKSKASSDPLPE